MAKKQKPDRTGRAPKPVTVRKSEAIVLPSKDSSDPVQRLTVRGTVSYADKSPAIGLTVIAFDKDVAGEDQLGEKITDAKARFEIGYSGATFRRSSRERGGADVFVRVYGANADLLFQSKTVRNAPAKLRMDVQLPVRQGESLPDPPFAVRGQVRLADDTPLAGVRVRAYLKDLRRKKLAGERITGLDGSYEIRYSLDKGRRAHKDRADLVVEVLAADDAPLSAAPILFNAPLSATVDVIVPAGKWQPPTLFEKIGRALAPILDGLKIEAVEENRQHQDLTFLAGRTRFAKGLLARFVIAHKLAAQGIRTEFWFALLGGSKFEFAENHSLAEQTTALLDSLPSFDDSAVRKSCARALERKDIPEGFRKDVPGWTEAFLKLAARQSISATVQPSLARLALEDAGIKGAQKRETFSRHFNEHRTLTPALVDVLENDTSFTKAEVADLRTSFQLNDLTRGDFSLVKMLKEEFDVRQPEQIRILAKQSESDWVTLVKAKHAAGEIQLPFEVGASAGPAAFPAAEIFGKTLERRFREAFPTAAFAGGLERALNNDGAHGLRHADTLSQFLKRHDDFELLTTPVDQFLKKNDVDAGFESPAQKEAFRLEAKAAQRAFKLVPAFEAVDTLLADNLHSAQQVYRLGESEFVRRYADQPGFTEATARLAWTRAADTYATVVTIVGDLQAFEPAGQPAALQNNNEALSSFPNWDQLFQTGDLCDCEHCRSALGPAAYFADLLTFLKDRKAAGAPHKAGDPIPTVKDTLFSRRPDLGFLELNCDNALTSLPYIDVVCEVLEAAVDATHANDLVVALPAFSAPDAKAAVAKALQDAFADSINKEKEQIALGDDFSLSQVRPTDPDQWVVHGDDVTYLFKKKAALIASAEILRNTKAGADELRAYPQYVNPKAYEQLRAATYPLTLPFDLFAEEVRAACQKAGLQRWDVMRTLRGPSPNNPTDGEIAAEYFGISAGDEKRFILEADTTIPGQQAFWGENGNGKWLNTLANVKTFLRKSGLEYEGLLALLDLPFVNPKHHIDIHHLDESCDTDRKILVGLDTPALDRIHRFLRLSRKLTGWKMWELDLVIRHGGIGAGVLDEPFLINLFYFSRLRKRLGAKATVEQVCALFGDLNTETRFTALHEKREDALYQNLFLNKRLINPIDPAFGIDLVKSAATPHRLVDHHPVILAALGIRESDVVLLETLTKASDDKVYISHRLTLGNLSFLWRQAWLSKLLKFKAEEWKTILKVFQQDLLDFATPEAAWNFVEQIDQLKAAGLTPDELNWILAADRSAKAATSETNAARFLAALRKDLQAIRVEYDVNPSQHALLYASGDVGNLTTLLVSLLQKLNRSDAEVSDFLKTLRGGVLLEARVQGVPPFVFAAPIAADHIPIQYDKPSELLRFTGLMSDKQRKVLLDNAPLPAVVGDSVYANAIADLFQQSRTAANDYVSVEMEVALPGGLKLPTGSPSLPVRYNSTTHKLGFTGVMTNHELSALIAAGNPSGAMTALFQLPRVAVKFFEPVFTAPLDALPPAVDFTAELPADVAAKISYDVEQRVLRFAGIMSDAEHAAIGGLVANVLPSDVAYHRAVDSLRAQPDAAPAIDDNRIWLRDDDLDLTRPANDTLANRVANAARKAFNFLSATLAENAVVQRSSVELGLTEALTRRVLTSYAVVPIVPAPPLPPTKTTLVAHFTGDFKTDATTFNGWFWANRVAAILKKWKITLAELERIIPLTSDAKLLDFGTLPLADSRSAIAPIDRYLRSSQLLRLRDSLPETDVTLLDVLGRLKAGSYISSADFGADVQRLNDAWLAADAKVLKDSLDVARPADYLLAETWERLGRAFSFLDNLNAGADTVSTFAAPVMSSSHAKTIKELLRSKLGTETWLALAAEIQDILRERKRDALVAFLLTKPPAAAPSGKWENANDLYAYYLLDVEMSSCQLTSRLVQGSGSIQLFVQRCFMGLEPYVVVDGGPEGDSAWHWWTWMRKYRVWEANRKVFLWPENWIEPELKKDKSPFFKDLENELLQNEVNQFTVETAFSNYLEKLDGVAQLEIAGFYQEDDGEDAIVHVFGRTAAAEPHLYYYRRYDYRQWTPWEKVELDIQGDYLIPAVVNKRLFLFWPVFTEVPDEATNSRMRVPVPGQKRFTPDQTSKKLRLQMAVSEYRQGKWTPKKVSKDFDESESYTAEIVKEHYRFYFIDRGDGPDGHVGIQYSGHSVGSAAAAKKTEADLKQVAKDALEEKEAAARIFTDLDTIDLPHAIAAVVAVQLAVSRAKELIPKADNILAVSENSILTAGHVENLFRVYDNGSDNFPWLETTTQTAAGLAKSAVELATGPGSDAVLDASAFVEALQQLHLALRATRASANAASNGKEVVVPLAKAALTAANMAADAGADALRSARAFRTATAADRKSADKDLKKATADEKDANDAYVDFKPDVTAHAIFPAEDTLHPGQPGFFEISGCTGVPEKADFVGTFTPAFQPEQASVGDAATFLKWEELTSRSDAPSQDDLTLVHHFSARPDIPDTAVLGQTPDLFRMSVAWQLSYMDKAARASNPSYDTLGTWLPFFYSDKKRTFFVLPSSQFSDAGGPDVSGYYPRVKKYLNEASTGDMEIAAADAAGYGVDLQQYLGYLFATMSEDKIQFQKFHFTNFYHPYVCEFARLVYDPLQGIPSLMSRETQLKHNTLFSFEQSYQPTDAVLKLPPQYPLLDDCYPREVVDFTADGAYSPYNWELFFHAPLMIANSLSKNQRFEDARDWYHFIFNPLGLEKGAPKGSAMSKYWITKPFFEATDPQYIQQRIDNILRMLSVNKSQPGQPLTELELQVRDWRTNPFEPHRIANYRTVAYQKTVVMKYIENLVAWGDNLFSQDGIENINEATQLYILAAEILGPRPKKIPPQAKPPVQSFNELEAEFDKFSNALVEVENLVPQPPGNVRIVGAHSSYGSVSSQHSPPPLPMLYFCIPQNDKLLAHWDTVADRLYKIRHCMNLQGVVRQLALFEPPIDPAALVKAVAAGVDISATLADLNAPLPLYRFNVLLQKANEVCNDVKALGSALLVALDKKDMEAMGLLRQSQEIRVLDAVKTLKEKQIEEATENLDGVKKSKELITIRRDYYQNIEYINPSESLHQEKLQEALLAQQFGQLINIYASVAHAIPSIDIGAAGWGGTPTSTVMFGGSNIGNSLQAVAGAFGLLANVENYNANMASINAGQERRWDDWKFQESLANKELEQIDKSIAAAELRLAIAKKELENHVLQIENARSVDAFMRSKYTNEELFQWQVGQISGVYFQSYKLAYDLAKRAERCLRFELGLSDSSYVSFGYWDSLKKGLLSGEKLQYDLRRLETAYLEQNRREYELTKHVSLALLDPLALVKLRETGRCFLRLPEEMFDLDYPGHYFRRIKSVSVTLPCVVGPYTTISCTLRLLKNSIRINTAMGDRGYARNAADNGLPADDGRFVENSIPVKAIAASNAQNDSGVFELSFRDERYLPFEGAGAVSEWSLELFNDLPSNNPDTTNPDFGTPLRQFDYGSISDAILHVKYTAREDAGAFKNGAVTHLRQYLSGPATTPSLRLFNLRQEFPTQWHRFLNPTPTTGANILEFEMSTSRFAFRDSDKKLNINSIWLLARCTAQGNYSAALTPYPSGALPGMSLTRVNQYGGLHFNHIDLSALGIAIEVLPTDAPATWQIRMTRPGGDNLEDQGTKIMEVEDVLLVLGYEWSVP